MKKFISLFLILILLLSFTGCNKEKQKFTDYSFECFDTVTTIIGFETRKQTFDKNAKKIKQWLMEYHKLYDIYTEYENVTNLYTLNSSQNTEVTVDKKIIDLLDYSKSLYTKTKGEFNIAMGSVLSIWHNFRQNGIAHPENAQLPPENLLKSASQHTKIDNIIVDEKNNTVLINDSKLTVDVGAVAKGYAAQKVAEKCLKEGITGYLLNIGGNIKIVGERHDNKPWDIGIENPDRQSDNDYIEKLSLKDMSLVTSGSYQRFYTVNEKNYHHIIDPNTLYPTEYFTSVSVLAKNCALADVLSTALFCLDLDEGKQLLQDFDGVDVMWVTKDGEKLYTDGFKNYISQ